MMVWTALALAGAYPIWFALPFMVREFVQHVYIRPTASALGVVLAANMWGKLKTLVQTLVLIALCWLEFFHPLLAKHRELGEAAEHGADRHHGLGQHAQYHPLLRGLAGRAEGATLAPCRATHAKSCSQQSAPRVSGAFVLRACCWSAAARSGRTWPSSVCAPVSAA
ncbi:MAG: hypothetical protein M5U25_04800 [Planctomycetota bacterium]|nr:hypothetical protein [Planctomycetota bacterium]